MQGYNQFKKQHKIDSRSIKILISSDAEIILFGIHSKEILKNVNKGLSIRKFSVTLFIIIVREKDNIFNMNRGDNFWYNRTLWNHHM